MLDVVNRLVEKLSDVIVVEPVDDAAAIAVTRDQPECAEEPELVRYRRLLHSNRSRQLSD